MRRSRLATSRLIALIGATSLLAALFGGSLAAAEPSEPAQEVLESVGIETESDDDDVLGIHLRSPSRAGCLVFSAASRRLPSLPLRRAHLARGPPSHA